MRERDIDPVSHCQYPSLRNFLEAGSYQAGVHTVMQRGLPIDVKHDPRGYDVTTVFFHAAIPREGVRFPIFPGAGISETLPTNRIFVSDPSLYLSDRLRLAWFAGNHRQFKLQGVLTNILKALIPEGQRVVTFGPSGGGFAALYYATRLPGATAVPVNPQTNLATYSRDAVARYGRLGWRVTGADVLGQIPAVTNLVDLYRRPTGTRVFYVQNRFDSVHVGRQLEPFMEGQPSGHRVHPVLLGGEVGHFPPPKRQTRAVLAAAIRGAEVPPSQAALDALGE